ncbi:C3a anaphylatoxin chemotactic receptor-like [Sinocyclocheilus anshuiensis]|uniref:C3a anaphylatoxin chemotactic receptor-like n=1 Tax=Sinocyclocheilus anshuiensis TaxID=1608454 RepID=UPI0007B99807|nr:PREDICTED: C3a anaphylatoxin chemotactic receptor-like [Sinocyclocheilus anshuiensis]
MENTSFEAENMTRDTAHNITMQQEEFTSFEIFVLCIFFATFVVGLVGNGLVIFLTGCRMKTTVNSIWFLNLAIADFIFLLSLICYLVTVSVLDRWNSDLMIFILFMLLPLSLFTSIFFLVVISLDRCVCTWMVVWAKNKRTLLKARIICIIVWVSSFSCSIPFFEDITSLVTYEFIVGFLIPLLIIVTSYIAIGVRIKRLKMGKQLKSYHVIITVTLVFFICWFPYYVCLFYSITAVGNNPSASDQYIFKIVSIYLVCLNSCLNPVLYVFMCDEYKKKLKQSLLLVLETAFAEDYLDFKADAKGRAGHGNQTEMLDMLKTGP